MKILRVFDKISELYVPIFVSITAFAIHMEYMNLKDDIDYIRRYVR